MAYTMVVHIINADAVVGETDELPAVTDSLVMIKNPRRLDGKDLHYLADNVVTVYWPIDKINFIEVIAGEAEEEIIGFVRE